MKELYSEAELQKTWDSGDLGKYIHQYGCNVNHFEKTIIKNKFIEIRYTTYDFFRLQVSILKPIRFFIIISKDQPG